MKYLVITSKHHDGFAIYDSAVSDYDIVDATPFGRDVSGGARRSLPQGRHSPVLLSLSGSGLARAQRLRQ